MVQTGITMSIYPTLKLQIKVINRELLGVNRLQPNYQGAWEANWVFHNTSISRIDISSSSRNVVYLNRIDHLPVDLVTW